MRFYFFAIDNPLRAKILNFVYIAFGGGSLNAIFFLEII